jgi:hypothetical protein
LKKHSMKKMIVRCVVVSLLIIGLAAPALALEPPGKRDIREEHVMLDLSLVEGTTRGPSGSWIANHPRPEFFRLLKLKKKSFLPALQLTARQLVR